MRELFATAAAAVIAGTAHAQTPELKFAWPTPPFGALYQNGFSKWVEDVNKEAAGAGEIKVFPGGVIGNFGNVYDRVLNGVADIGFGIHGPISSQFPKTNIVTLPFETRNGEEAGIAMWRLYERGLIADEYARIHLLELNVFPNVMIHLKDKPVRKMEDLKGLKITAEGRFISQTVTRLGATPVSSNVGELYQSLQRGTVDGISIAWIALETFKLYEQTHYHVEASLANDDGFLFMNKDSYAKLPAKMKAAVDKYSYEPLVRRIVKVIADATESARKLTMSQPNQHMINLEPAEEARWRAAVAPVTEDWVKSVPNGAAILAAYREEVKKVRDGSMAVGGGRR
jgi:TRAP-type C4-dicarboxylate transport system substrate-binding protein